MQQDQLFSSVNDKPKNQFDLGKGLILDVKENYPRTAILSQNGIVIKRCKLAYSTQKTEQTTRQKNTKRARQGQLYPTALKRSDSRCYSNTHA